MTTEHQRLIQHKLDRLHRMKGYLEYSLSQVQAIGSIESWSNLTPDQHESLAAFRVRFSEFQEQLGKAMRAVAIEEEEDVERFGSVLGFMERLKVLDSSEHWKLIRELRNAVNHEYEEDSARLTAFFGQLQVETVTLLDYLDRLVRYCQTTYRLR